MFGKEFMTMCAETNFYLRPTSLYYIVNLTIYGALKNNLQNAVPLLRLGIRVYWSNVYTCE